MLGSQPADVKVEIFCIWVEEIPVCPANPPDVIPDVVVFQKLFEEDPIALPLNPLAVPPATVTTLLAYELLTEFPVPLLPINPPTKVAFGAVTDPVE